MKKYDYVEEEYFLFGYANIYGPSVKGVNVEQGVSAVENIKPLGGLVQPRMPYATRVLMVRPRDNAKFSGRVHAYTFHNLNAYVSVERNLLRVGDAVLGLEGCSGTRFGPLETPSGGIAQLHKVDLERYRDLHFSYANPLAWPDLKPGKLAEAFKTMDFGSAGGSSGVFLQEISRSYAQAPDVITQLAHALKSNNPAFPFEGKVKRLFNFGASGGSTILQPYIDLHHNSGMMTDGRPPFDGYLVLVGLLPETRPKGAILVYMESEGEFITGINMGRSYPPDTDNPPFRIYQIPGTGHVISAPLPEVTAAQAGTELRDVGKIVPEGIVGLSDRGEAPPDVLPYDKINTPIIWGLWNNMYTWIERGVPMPKLPRIKRNPKAPDGIERDEYGNALGGLRTPWVEVPDATYRAKFSQKNPLIPGMRPFSDQKMKELYGTREHYLQLVNEKIDQMIRNRWIMAEDADLMRLKP
ncbi:MAG: alpha/beta hydrolase domain-containing protein [Dehalococcoidales bacterium]|nr:alpha/beta hydrolase domain-containing protein [Dehalococcoidales bacterium]